MSLKGNPNLRRNSSTPKLRADYGLQHLVSAAVVESADLPPSPWVPIGHVRSDRAHPIDDDWDHISAEIVLDPTALTPDAVAGLREFSHIEVVYVFDRVDPRSVHRGSRRPRGNPDWPEVGILAQRAKDRPNRIGLARCRVVSIDGYVIGVQDLDAIDGTPVIDIKPWMDEFGPRGPVTQPAWSREIMSGYWGSDPAAGTSHLATGESYDRVAADYARDMADELSTKPLDRALIEAVAELAGPGLALDAGSGPAQVATHFASHAATHSATHPGTHPGTHAAAHAAAHVPTQAGTHFGAGGGGALACDISPAMCAEARAAGVPAVAGDLTSLPVRSGSLSTLYCFYAVIHLDAGDRVFAYRELARVLRPGGHAIVAFHTSDADRGPGGAVRRTEWWGRPVELTFRFLDASAELALLLDAGLDFVAHLDRAPGPVPEHPSRRSYLVVRRPASV